MTDFDNDVKERAQLVKASRPRCMGDNKMTEKERVALNGTVKSYRLNEPMLWAEFCKLPDDVQALYLKNLRKAFYINARALSEMMGVSEYAISLRIKKLSLANIFTKGGRHRTAGEKADWAAFIASLTEKPIAAPVEQKPVTEMTAMAINEYRAAFSGALDLSRIFDLLKNALGETPTGLLEINYKNSGGHEHDV